MTMSILFWYLNEKKTQFRWGQIFIQAEVDGTGSEIEVSDGEISELDRAERLADLYTAKLPDLIEKLLNPLLFHLVGHLLG